MAKFIPTKTQAELLAKLAASSFNRISVERGSGRGPQGGKVSYGNREVRAALALERAGLLVRVSLTREDYPERGNTVTHTAILYRAPTGG